MISWTTPFSEDIKISSAYLSGDIRHIQSEYVPVCGYFRTVIILQGGYISLVEFSIDEFLNQTWFPNKTITNHSALDRFLHCYDHFRIFKLIFFLFVSIGASYKLVKHLAPAVLYSLHDCDVRRFISSSVGPWPNGLIDTGFYVESSSRKHIRI